MDSDLAAILFDLGIYMKPLDPDLKQIPKNPKSGTMNRLGLDLMEWHSHFSNFLLSCHIAQTMPMAN